MNRCWRSREAASPAPDRPPGPRCRTTRSQRRAGSGRPSTSDHVTWGLAASFGPFVFFLLFIELPQHLVETLRHPLVDDTVVHGAELLADLAQITGRSPISALRSEEHTSELQSHSE